MATVGVKGLAPFFKNTNSNLSSSYQNSEVLQCFTWSSRSNTDVDWFLLSEPARTRMRKRCPNEAAVETRYVSFRYSSAQWRSADHWRHCRI